MKFYTSIAIGVFVGILTAFSINLVTTWQIVSFIIGLLAGLEAGYWSHDKEKSKKIHREVLLENIPRFIYQKLADNEIRGIICHSIIFIVLLAVYYINATYGAAWLAGKVFPQFNFLTAIENKTQFYSYFGQNNIYADALFLGVAIYGAVSMTLCILGVVFFFIFLISFLSGDLRDKIEIIKYANFVLGIMAFLGAVSTILTILALVIFCIVIAFYVLYFCATILIIAVDVTCRYSADHEGFALTTSIVLGIVSGIAYSGFTRLAFVPTLVAIVIGVIIGCIEGYVTIKIGKFMLELDDLELKTALDWHVL